MNTCGVVLELVEVILSSLCDGGADSLGSDDFVTDVREVCVHFASHDKRGVMKGTADYVVIAAYISQNKQNISFKYNQQKRERKVFARMHGKSFATKTALSLCFHTCVQNILNQ